MCIFIYIDTHSTLFVYLRYQINLEPTIGIVSPAIPDETFTTLEKQLNSYSDWTLTGKIVYSIQYTVYLVRCIGQSVGHQTPFAGSFMN